MRKTCSRTARFTGSLQDCLDSTTLKNMKSNTLFELTKIMWSTQKHILAFNLPFFKSEVQNHLNWNPIKQLNLTHSCESWNAGGQFKKSVLVFRCNIFVIRSDNVQIYEFLNLLALLVQEYFQEVILNQNCSNSQIRRRPHSWCWWVSPLPLSVNRVKREQVSIMCSVQKQKQSHIWHHSVPRLRLIIKNYLKDHNVKCIAAA